MSQEVLDYFGEVLVKNVRDYTISEWDRDIVRKNATVRAGKILYEKFKNCTPEQLELIRWLIPQVVDTTLHYFLCMFEQEENIDIAVTLDGEYIERLQDISDGLCGELYTEDGWISRFSKERYEEL